MKTAIVAHDAGAANHIFAWLSSGLLDNSQTRLCLQGPAAHAHSKQSLGFTNYPLETVLDGCDLLVSGTGWASDLEHLARLEAYRRGIKSIAVVDHWTNYRERFERGGTFQLPDEVWVSDTYAVRLLSSKLPGLKTVQQPNELIRQELAAITKYERQNQVSQILYVMEPIRKAWNDSEVAGEYQAFDYFVSNLSKLKLAGNKCQITIKPHPSDPVGKYRHLVEKHSDLELKVNEASPLAELIGTSDIVVGCETYAMVIALHAGKRVVSSLPQYAPSCVLPHREIEHLSQM